MRRPAGFRGRAAGLALALLVGSLPAMAATPTPPTAAGKPATNAADELDAWDRSTARLRTEIWLLHAGTAARGADPRGRTIDDDLAEWVTTPDSIATLARARREAGEKLAAGDRAGMAAALATGRAVQARLDSRFALLDTYWTARAGIDYQNQQWGRWAARAPANARADSRARLQAQEALVAARLSPAVTLGELGSALEDLGRAYNLERETLARLVGTSGEDGRVPPPRESRRACHAGAEPEPKGPASPQAEAIYPRDAQRFGVWGEVRVALSLSATGCPTRSSVLSSSGAVLLDAAALDWVEYAHFEPALMGGRPIASTTVLRLAFVLPGKTPEPGVDAATLRRNRALTELGGISLGMTRAQLEQAKGRPAASQSRSLSFNSVDAAHDGLLTAYFGAGFDDPDARVTAVDYAGDRASAPSDLPALRGLSRTEVTAQLGEPSSSDKLGKDAQRLRFRTGLYVDVVGGQVTNYGIVPSRELGTLEIRMTIEGNSLTAPPAPPARPKPAKPSAPMKT